MIINKEVLNSKPIIKENYTDSDLFDYTLEVASIMNNDIMLFIEAGLDGIKKVFDFSAIINAVIDALINAIKKIFKYLLAFLAELASMGSSFEIELRRFKERIKALGYNNNITLDFPYYEYTNLGADPSNKMRNRITDIITYYNVKFNEIMKSGSVGASKLVGLQTLLKEETQKKQNMFRYMLLHPKDEKGNGEFEGDFVSALFAHFRNDSNSPKNNESISGDRIYNEFYTTYVDANKEIKRIRKEQDEVDKNIRKIKSDVKRDFFKVDLSMYDYPLQQQITQSTISLQRQLCTIVDLMAQDLLVYYGQKLQAYKEYKLQCKQVLVAAIKACIIQ